MPALLSSKVSNNVRDHRLAVALQILHEHFGEITRDVAQCLMSIEFCTLAQLVKVVTNTYSTADSNKRLTSKHVKQVLLLLWKHNCLIIECHHEVDLTEVTLDINGLETKLKMIGLLYRLNYDYILHRLRFGQILHYIVKKFGELSGLITEEIIFHGRLRYATIVEEVLKKWTEEKKKKGGGGGDSEIGSSIAGAVKIEKGGYYQSEEDYMGDTSGSGDRGDEEDHETVNLRNQIKKTFENLVQHRYLVIVPPLDLKKREVSTYQSVTSKRLADLFGDDLKKTASTTSAASTTNKTSMKRSRGQAMVNESTITSPEELLPVELRLMINQASGDYLSVAKNGAGTGEADWDESTAPATKKVKIEDEGKGGRGRGRGGGRLNKLGGRGAGRGRGAREAGFYENEGMNPPEPSSSSSNNNSHTENIVRGEVYWMIGFDQFIREERHRVCIDIVADQLENVAGEIVRIILQQSMNQELGPNPSKSSAMSLEEIYQKIKESAKIHNDNNSNSNNNYSHGNSSSSSNSNSASNGNGSSNSNNNNNSNSNLLASLDMATVKKLLEIMRLSSLGTIVRIPGSESEPNGPLFLVNYESVIAALRRRTIFQIAQGRFGVSSGRIIELLQRNKYLEQQTVSDRAILPARETRERLYRLYRDRWVNYVELSKRGDFNPSNNYYFWYLDLPRLKLSLLELLYQTIYNLRIRKEAEIVKCKDLLEFALVSENDLKRYNQFMQKMNLLDFSIQRIDLMILLMEKF